MDLSGSVIFPTILTGEYSLISPFFPIGVGPNNVPSNSFDVGWLHNNIANGGQVLAFSSPILALFQQPLQITVTNNTQITALEERSVKVTLIGELAIQKIAARY
mgnify:CR=1 FL=1